MVRAIGSTESYTIIADSIRQVYGKNLNDLEIAAIRKQLERAVPLQYREETCLVLAWQVVHGQRRQDEALEIAGVLIADSAVTFRAVVNLMRRLGKKPASFYELYEQTWPETSAQRSRTELYHAIQTTSQPLSSIESLAEIRERRNYPRAQTLPVAQHDHHAETLQLRLRRKWAWQEIKNLRPTMEAIATLTPSFDRLQEARQKAINEGSEVTRRIDSLIHSVRVQPHNMSLASTVLEEVTDLDAFRHRLIRKVVRLDARLKRHSGFLEQIRQQGQWFYEIVTTTRSLALVWEQPSVLTEIHISESEQRAHILTAIARTQSERANGQKRHQPRVVQAVRAMVLKRNEQALRLFRSEVS